MECENLKAGKTIYNCSEANAKDLEQLSTLESPRLAVNTNLPINTKDSIFAFSTCMYKNIEMEKKMHLSYLSESDVRIRIINGFVPVMNPDL